MLEIIRDYPAKKELLIGLLAVFIARAVIEYKDYINDFFERFIVYLCFFVLLYVVVNIMRKTFAHWKEKGLFDDKKQE